jgi:hypothetical protein
MYLHLDVFGYAIIAHTHASKPQRLFLSKHSHAEVASALNAVILVGVLRSTLMLYLKQD